MKRITLVVVFAVGMLVGAWLALPRSEATAQQCRFPYTVKPGDTLSGIAVQAGVNVYHLAYCNGISPWHIDRIYVGQVLCLPRPIVQPDPEEQPRSSFDLVVEYTFDPSEDPDASNWTLGRNGVGGRRFSYPLASGDAIETFTETIDVRQASVDRSPILWLVRTSPEASSYILTVIGDPMPLLDLQMEMTPTNTVTDIIPLPDPDPFLVGRCPKTKKPVDSLSLSGKSQVRLRAELIGIDGTFVPVTITEIDYHQTVERAQSCYREVGFALHSTPNPDRDGYQLLMVLNEEGAGAPGNRWRPVVQRLQGRRGRWPRFVVAFYGFRWR